jgi:disulfide bond formation protein DsbB
MKKYILYYAWVLSLVGALLSVYSSEVLRMEPCPLCWYQRCALFPLAICLGVALYREDHHFSFYGLVLAGAGAVLAAIQVFFPLSLCGSDCIDKTPALVPILSLIGFVAIFFLLWKDVYSTQ